MQNEIKETMMNLFRDKLEQGVADMYGISSDASKDSQDQRVHNVDTDEGANFLGFIQA